MSQANSNNSRIDTLLLGIVAITAIIVLAFGVIRYPDSTGSLLIGIGGIGLLGLVVGYVIVTRLQRIGVQLDQLERRRSTFDQYAATLDRLERLMLDVRNMHSLGEAAKRVVLSEHEARVLQTIIEEKVAGGLLDEAQRICVALGSVGDWPDIVEWGNQMIAQARDDRANHQADESMANFDAALAQRDWSAAYQEAARLRQMYPDGQVAAQLDQRIAQARSEHKSHLESRFQDATDRDDVEDAMEVLRELDLYMTREEAERLSDRAHQIIARHRERLGLTFRIAVQERRWAEAARVGNTIIADYPNTKMADEVRSMIDLIRTRATQAALAAESTE